MRRFYVFIQSPLLVFVSPSACRPLTKSYFKLLPRYTFLYASWKRPPAIPNTRRNQFEFNLAFFGQAFVGSQLCLPYSISVISFITNWIWGSKSPSGLTGAFEIIFSLIRTGLVRRKWWGPCYQSHRFGMRFVKVKWQKLIISTKSR